MPKHSLRKSDSQRFYLDNVSKPFTDALNTKRKDVLTAIKTLRYEFAKLLKISDRLDVKIQQWFAWVLKVVNSTIDGTIAAGTEVSNLVRSLIANLRNIMQTKKWEDLNQIRIPYLVVRQFSESVQAATVRLNPSKMAELLQRNLTTEESVYICRIGWGRIQLEVDRWLLLLLREILDLKRAFETELVYGIESLDYTITYIRKQKGRKALVPILALQDLFLSSEKPPGYKMVLKQVKRAGKANLADPKNFESAKATNVASQNSNTPPTKV